MHSGQWMVRSAEPSLPLSKVEAVLTFVQGIHVEGLSSNDVLSSAEGQSVL